MIVRLDEPWEAALTTPLEGGRVQFANPWEGALLVGTTDEPFEGDPRDLEVTAADVEQIVRESRVSIEPGVVEPDRILSSFAGVRVLPQGDAETPSARRETVIERGDSGLLSIAGGKFTTFRRIALDALERLREDLDLHLFDRAPVPLPGAADPGVVAERLLAEYPALSAATAAHLARFHGGEAFDVLGARARGSGAARAARGRRSRGRRAGALGARAGVGADRGRRARAPHDARRARPRGRGALARGGAPAMTARYVAALDQGTTSTRCMLFDERGRTVATAQHEHRQITPRPGWVEHDADEILARSRTCIDEALAAAGAAAADVAAIGIANQRETVVLWERETGRPLANAIVWQDTRSAERVAALGSLDRFRAQTGLPLATYFSGPKLSWLLDELPGARERAEAGELAAGTIDSWLAWHLAGVHVTDATNASRTLLMDLDTLDWDDGLLETIGVPRALLPAIGPSSGVVGEIGGIPLASLLGDQQAALFGQCCFAPGEAKCTYGTGNFLLLNTGERRVPSSHGLITGIAYRLGEGRPPTCWRAPSPSRERSSSGCATTSG